MISEEYTIVNRNADSLTIERNGMVAIPAEWTKTAGRPYVEYMIDKVRHLGFPTKRKVIRFRSNNMVTFRCDTQLQEQILEIFGFYEPQVSMPSSKVSKELIKEISERVNHNIENDDKSIKIKWGRPKRGYDSSVDSYSGIKVEFDVTALFKGQVMNDFKSGKKYSIGEGNDLLLQINVISHIAKKRVYIDAVLLLDDSRGVDTALGAVERGPQFATRNLKMADLEALILGFKLPKNSLTRSIDYMHAGSRQGGGVETSLYKTGFHNKQLNETLYYYSGRGKTSSLLQRLKDVLPSSFFTEFSFLLNKLKKKPKVKVGLIQYIGNEDTL